MDEAEKALIAEGQAAGAPGQPPPGEEPEEAPPATGDAVMEIEDDEEPEQMKIVRDYKRPEQRRGLHCFCCQWLSHPVLQGVSKRPYLCEQVESMLLRCHATCC